MKERFANKEVYATLNQKMKSKLERYFSKTLTLVIYVERIFTTSWLKSRFCQIQGRSRSGNRTSQNIFVTYSSNHAQRSIDFHAKLYKKIPFNNLNCKFCSSKYIKILFNFNLKLKSTQIYKFINVRELPWNQYV